MPAILMLREATHYNLQLASWKFAKTSLLIVLSKKINMVFGSGQEGQPMLAPRLHTSSLLSYVGNSIPIPQECYLRTCKTILIANKYQHAPQLRTFKCSNTTPC